MVVTQVCAREVSGTVSRVQSAQWAVLRWLAGTVSDVRMFHCDSQLQALLPTWFKHFAIPKKRHGGGCRIVVVSSDYHG